MSATKATESNNVGLWGRFVELCSRAPAWMSQTDKTGHQATGPQTTSPGWTGGMSFPGVEQKAAEALDRAMDLAAEGDWGGVAEWLDRRDEGAPLLFKAWGRAAQAFAFFEQCAPRDLAGRIAGAPIRIASEKSEGEPPRHLPTEQIEQAAIDRGEEGARLLQSIGMLRISLWSRRAESTENPVGGGEWRAPIPPGWAIQAARIALARRQAANKPHGPWLRGWLSFETMSRNEGLAATPLGEERRRAQLAMVKALVIGVQYDRGGWREIGQMFATTETDWARNPLEAALSGWQSRGLEFWSDIFAEAAEDARKELVDGFADEMFSAEGKERARKEPNWNQGVAGVAMERLTEAAARAWGSERELLDAWPASVKTTRPEWDSRVEGRVLRETIEANRPKPANEPGAGAGQAKPKRI
jgi:hypothetical protein